MEASSSSNVDPVDRCVPGWVIYQVLLSFNVLDSARAQVRMITTWDASRWKNWRIIEHIVHRPHFELGTLRSANLPNLWAGLYMLTRNTCWHLFCFFYFSHLLHDLPSRRANQQSHRLFRFLIRDLTNGSFDTRYISCVRAEPRRRWSFRAYRV